MTCSRRCRRLNHHHHYHREERARERERRRVFLSFFLSFGMNTCRSLSLPSSLTKRLSSFSFFYPAKKLKNEPTKESTFSLKKFHHILFSRTKKNRAFVHTHASNEPTRDDYDFGRVVGETGGRCIFLLDSSSISRDRRSRRDALRAK